MNRPDRALLARSRSAGHPENNGTLLTGGTISLQSESHPVEIRKVELLVLPE